MSPVHCADTRPTEKENPHKQSKLDICRTDVKHPCGARWLVNAYSTDISVRPDERTRRRQHPHLRTWASKDGTRLRTAVSDSAGKVCRTGWGSLSLMYRSQVRSSISEPRRARHSGGSISSTWSAVHPALRQSHNVPASLEKESSREC